MSRPATEPKSMRGTRPRVISRYFDPSEVLGALTGFDGASVEWALDYARFNEGRAI
jgi:hypothetical protein